MNRYNFVGPYKNDSSVGHLSTPITDSILTRTLLMYLPIYRYNLSNSLRGLEIGMAHGYFLIGPFYKLGPLRNSETALLVGYLSTIGLIIILSVTLSLYGTTLYSQTNKVKSDEQPNRYMLKPTLMSSFDLEHKYNSKILSEFEDDFYLFDPSFKKIFKDQDAWNQFTGGFFIGGLGGAGFALLLLSQIR